MSELSLRLQAKRSIGTTPPNDLLFGEIAYSDANQTMWIGREVGEPAAFEAGQEWTFDDSLNLFVGKQKATSFTIAVANGATATFIPVIDYLGYDSVYIEGVYYAIQTVDSSGKIDIQLRGIRGDGLNGAWLSNAFYSSPTAASQAIKGYGVVNAKIDAPNVFGGALVTYTRTLGSGGAAIGGSIVYRNLKP